MQIIAIIFGVAFLGYIFLFLLFYLFIGGSTRGAKAISKEMSNQYYLRDDKVVFASNGNFFNLGSTDIEDADNETFKVLAQNFAKDKNHVYYNEILIEEADPETFCLLYDGENSSDGKYIFHYYSKDKNNVYHFNERMADVDTSTFEILWGYYTRDCHSIYYDKIKLASSSEPAVRLENDSQHVYLKIGNKIYYKDHLLEVSDVDFFEILEFSFAKDNLHVFFHSEVVPDIHPFHFKVLNDSYQSDGDSLYYNLKKIPNSEPDSYQFVSTNYSLDKSQVYFCGRVLMGVEPDGFNQRKIDQFDNHRKFINLTYDDNHTHFVKRSDCVDISDFYTLYNKEVYCFTNRLAGADYKTIKPLVENDGIYCVDKINVYYTNQKIHGADKSTFKVINREFSKDANHVYYMDKHLLNISPDNFEYRDGMYANQVDKNTAELVLPNNEKTDPFIK